MRNSAQKTICDFGERTGIVGTQGAACARAGLWGHPATGVPFPGEETAAHS